MRDVVEQEPVIPTTNLCASQHRPRVPLPPCQILGLPHPMPPSTRSSVKVTARAAAGAPAKRREIGGISSEGTTLETVDVETPSAGDEEGSEDAEFQTSGDDVS